MRVDLYPHQTQALRSMHNGCIVNGGVGSGKSIVSIAYYFTKVCGGSFRTNGKGVLRDFTTPKDLVIFTTAKKRDSGEWSAECARFSLSSERAESFGNVQVTIDSWNNIVNYQDLKDCFVIFDEQRLVGSGAWVKSFYKIAKNNEWIILSATPGDNWMDYIPVFVANGFFKNKTEFQREHVIFNQYSKFPKVDSYRGTKHLNELRRQVLVEMPYLSKNKRHLKTWSVEFDQELVDRVMKDRWHILEERPIRDVSELFALMRRVVNSHESRTDSVITLQAKHPRLIIFYNFNYELDALRALCEELGWTYAEWNGQKHQEIPKTKSWVYLVQYTAGAEGWNCITTDAMIFYSLNYSYKIFEQAQGRTDRLNTKYTDLYYYIFRSNAWIDKSIWKSIATKRNFNESVYKF